MRLGLTTGRAHWRRLVLVFLLLPFFGTVSAAAETVTLGVLAHRGETAAREKWQQTADYLSAELPGHDVTLLPLTLEGVEEALTNNAVDFLLTNPGHFNIIADRFRLTRIASLRTDRAGVAVTGNRYGAVILTRSDRDDITSLSDLEGKTFAAVAPDAFGGFLIAADALRRNGVDPAASLKTIIYKGFPQDQIVTAVLSGEADAGTVRTGVVESMIRQGRIRREDVRILNPKTIAGFELLLSTDVYPEWTFAAAQDVAAVLKRQTATALLKMSETSPAARAGGYGGWNTPMYDGKVRSVLSSAKGGEASSVFSGGSLTIWIASVLFGVTAALTAVFAIARLRRAPVEATAPDGGSTLPENLTPRENEVLRLVISGLTNKEIAHELSISPKTVEFHRRHLMEKFDAQNVADLIRKALGHADDA